MSGSGYSPFWRRLLQRNAQFLFKVCLASNYHWRWNKWCWCNDHVNGQDGQVLIGEEQT